MNVNRTINKILFCILKQEISIAFLKEREKIKDIYSTLIKIIHVVVVRTM